MTVKVDSSVRWWNRKAMGYAKRPIADMEAYQKKLALTREYLKPESKVLEFGCGTGSTALEHAPYAGQILAIDSSAKMIEIAQAKPAAANLRFRHATLFDLSDEPGAYDVILGLNVLHLLDDMNAALARCFQLLKPGGAFISGTACIAVEPWLLRKLLPIGGMLGLIPKVKIFGFDTLENAIQGAGFKIVRNERFNKSGHNAFIVAEKPA